VRSSGRFRGGGGARGFNQILSSVSERIFPLGSRRFPRGEHRRGVGSVGPKAESRAESDVINPARTAQVLRGELGHPGGLANTRMKATVHKTRVRPTVGPEE